MTATVTPTATPAAPAAVIKAWRFSRAGRPAETLRLEEDIAMPSLPPPAALLSRAGNNSGKGNDDDAAGGGGEWLLVRVAYTALNPGSQFHFNIVPAFARAATAVPELDFCGTVVDVWAPSRDGDATGARGEEQQQQQQRRRRFAKGDPVVGFLPITFAYPTGEGALASHVRVPARYVVRLSGGSGSTSGDRVDDNTSKSADGVNSSAAALERYAGLICATCTAVMLADEARLKRGDSVLVVGASGGVGTSTVQLARSIVGSGEGESGGGRVVAVCSGRNAELVKGLGADEVIDYTQHRDLPAELARRFSDTPFDAILDCHGNQAVYVHCAKYLKASSKYVACSAEMESWSFGHFLRSAWRIQCNTYWPLSPWLGGVGRGFMLVAMMDPGRELMERAVRLVADGTVNVCVDSVWGYQDVLKGYEVLESGRGRGKILVKWD
ncbi:hypothetical protein Micbo1qcDRAFT_203481 [Microdochium bolleyi]|uniref:Enoyl reductase (ER) domain-containing protein n=1 Tax=Microdochium bolleyi TaxID=196109 RepID=A0A136J8D2_9PEZI|nr:hypothetical protein Micbo1qcDRAFT_203481 [Microdochium bolleyi]